MRRGSFLFNSPIKSIDKKYYETGFLHVPHAFKCVANGWVSLSTAELLLRQPLSSLTLLMHCNSVQRKRPKCITPTIITIYGDCRTLIVSVYLFIHSVMDGKVSQVGNGIWGTNPNPEGIESKMC